jgi:hypothetical protein
MSNNSHYLSVVDCPKIVTAWDIYCQGRAKLKEGLILEEFPCFVESFPERTPDDFLFVEYFEENCL